MWLYAPSIIATSNYSWRTADFTGRHVDAERSPGVAGLSNYRLVSTAWFRRFRKSDPGFLVAPLGGAVADRFNRQRIVIATQVASMILALVLSVLTLTGWIQKGRVWPVFVLAALLGIVNAFDIPGRQSFLVDMVGKEDLMNAIALNSSMFNGARIIGPAIAGIVVARIGEGWCFFANGISYIAVIIGLLLMNVTLSSTLEIKFTFGRYRGGISVCERNGANPRFVAFVRSGKPGRNALHGANACFRRSNFARRSERPRHFDGVHWNWRLVGCRHACPAFWRKRLRQANCRRLCKFRSESLLFLFLSRNFWLSALLLLASGFSMMLDTAQLRYLDSNHRARCAPRGRVMGRLYSMMFMGMAPFGALLGGAMADRVGAPITVAVGAVPAR